MLNTVREKVYIRLDLLFKNISNTKVPLFKNNRELCYYIKLSNEIDNSVNNIRNHLAVVICAGVVNAKPWNKKILNACYLKMKSRLDLNTEDKISFFNELLSELGRDSIFDPREIKIEHPLIDSFIHIQQEFNLDLLIKAATIAKILDYELTPVDYQDIANTVINNKA